MRCPLPLLKLKQWLAKASEGDQVQLIVDDPQSINDVPKWLSTTAHQLLAIETQQSAVIIRIQK
ncbi:sulfurtransferase TusA family protein [Salinibius halmophilus]|uniref:sulfurtransferase TusA family protein n=1 Tax=Salinibius halmophilus TaxID=1853216 RepID=UPI0018F46794|nr:sulfurtransferase TusA family protein [Salinibius halmophilus]